MTDISAESIQALFRINVVPFTPGTQVAVLFNGIVDTVPGTYVALTWILNKLLPSTFSVPVLLNVKFRT